MTTTIEYNGREITVERVEDVRSGQYPNEFVCTVDDAEVMTATRLERDYGIAFEAVPNWTVALRQYARAFVDGQEAAR